MIFCIQSFIDWDKVSIYQKLSESFIREFADCVNWKLVSQYQKLSESFIREFSEDVYWRLIWQYQEFSEDFMREFLNSLEWCIYVHDIDIPQNIRDIYAKILRECYWL